LDLRARRSPTVVAPSTAHHQRVDGHLRHLIAGHFVSRRSPVADSDYYTRFRDWRDDRYYEITEHPFESAQCSLVPSRARHRRGLRNLRRARLAEDARHPA